MKVFKIIGIVIAVAVCVLTLWGGISLAYDVTHSMNPHNLSANSGTAFSYMTLQVCVFCHTPHGANTQVHQSTYWNATAPGTYQNTAGTGSFLLWNRALANLPASGYATYQSSTQDASPTGIVRSYSLMCMSCHDGVSAINVLTNLPNEAAWYWWTDPYAGAGGTGLTTMGGAPETIKDLCTDCGVNIGDMDGTDTVINLANDHPISFDYDATLVGKDKGLVTPNNTAGYVGVPEVRLFRNNEGNFASVECSTCHDPHTYETGGRVPFLVISNQNSALCLNCHIK
jgi:predicted CXXCH cytochrome family protein